MRAQRKLISFIGIGSSSAAPLLYSFIKAHPKICVPDIETNFFSDTKAYAQGINWYEGLFGVCKEGQIHGELALDYLQKVSSVSLIAKTYPSAKLLAVIENPLVSVKVAYLKWLRSKNPASKVSLAQFLKQNPEVLAAAKYGKQLTHFFSYYSPTDLLVLTAEEVREEPLANIKKTYKYLEVDDSFVPLPVKHLVPIDEDDGARKPGLIKRTIKLIRRLLTIPYRYLLKKFQRKSISVEIISEEARRMTIAPELEEFLKNYYRQDVKVLSNLLHRNLNVEWEIE